MTGCAAHLSLMREGLLKGHLSLKLENGRQIQVFTYLRDNEFLVTFVSGD